MIVGRREARTLLASGLLLPALLLIAPATVRAETRQARAAAKRALAKSSPTAKAPKTTAPAATRPEVRCAHVARRGDTAGRVASRHHVSRQALVEENRLAVSGVIKTGQRLAIPGCRPAAKRPAPAPTTAAVELDDGLLLARVGPQRVPTRLYVAVPEFSGDAIAFGWPVEGPIASGFGRRHGGWHAGIDIQADPGTPVLASAAGVVVFSGWAPFYGRVIKIQHPRGFLTVYAHNSENLVQPGDAVAAGSVIAMVGRSGHASAEHVHFEIRRDGMAFNPLYLLDGRDTAPMLASTTAQSADDDGGDGEVP